MPMELLGGVRLVVNIDGDLFPFLEAEQWPRELTVVSGRGDDVIRGQFHRLHGDGQGVIRGAAGFERSLFGLGRCRLLAAHVMEK